MLILQPWLSIPKFLYLNFRSPLYYTLATNGSHATIDLAYHFRSPLYRSQQLLLLFSSGFFWNFNLDPVVEYPFLATLISYLACILRGFSDLEIDKAFLLFHFAIHIFLGLCFGFLFIDSSLAFSCSCLPSLS